MCNYTLLQFMNEKTKKENNKTGKDKRNITKNYRKRAEKAARTFDTPEN